MAGSCITAALIVLSLVTFLVAIFLNAYLNIPGISPFNETIANISHKYDTGITPSDATFGIWGLIYLWLLALCVYCQTLLCRKARCADRALYVYPGFVPSLFFVAFILSMLGNPGWIVVYLMEKLVVGSAILAIGVLTALICLMSSVDKLDKCGTRMVRLGLTADIWCTRIIIQNGVALYLAWVSCACLLQGISTAVYIYSVAMDMACWTALSLLTAIVVAWFFAETFLFDRKLRYVFAHYIAFLAALSGGYVKNYNPSIGYTQYLLGLLITVSALTVLKITIIIVRSIKDPIYYKPKN